MSRGEAEAHTLAEWEAEADAQPEDVRESLSEVVGLPLLRCETLPEALAQALEDGVEDAHGVALVEGVGLPLRRAVREALPHALLDTEIVGEAETLALREPLWVMVAVGD